MTQTVVLAISKPLQKALGSLAKDAHPVLIRIAKSQSLILELFPVEVAVIIAELESWLPANGEHFSSFTRKQRLAMMWLPKLRQELKEAEAK